jgi:small nuclear ribonucleoprotein (snRNP)-like protein
MFKNYMVLTLAILTLNLSLSASISIETKDEKEAKAAEKIKVNVAKLGTGKDARVEVKLKDGTKVKGYVSETSESSFVVMNEKTAVFTEVPYQQTRQVKGNNLSTGAKIAIVVAGVIGVALLIGLLARGS